MPHSRTRRPDSEGRPTHTSFIDDEDDSDAVTVMVDPRLLGVLDLPQDAIEPVSEPEVISLDSNPRPLPPSPSAPPVVAPMLLATALFGAVLGCFAAVWWVLG